MASRHNRPAVGYWYADSSDTVNESSNNIHCEAKWVDFDHRGDRLSKPIVGEALNRVHSIFYSLLREREWQLFVSHPTAISWVYLPADSVRVHARIEWPPSPEYGNPIIYVHPFAFEWNDEHLLKGLIHHELCHYILGADAGHGRSFQHMEQGWDDYFLYKQQATEFGRWLRRQKPIWRLECTTCDTVQYRSVRPKEGTACAKCCRRFNKGEWSAKFKFHIGGAPTGE